MILEKINSPADVRSLDKKDLELLCSEIRGYMVECCSKNPGHLASSLGAVEIIVGLHSVFNTPEDKIVFDVGHQAYAHKIITGRREAFRSFRTKDGISGFPKMQESPYDAFGVGHSSTSISAALGLAEAARLQGKSEKVIAVIGDGALTGGLAFEGLNNTGSSSADLLVIINDNNQSIDPNKGGLHNYLLRITTSKHYNRFKSRVWNILGEGGIRQWVQRWLRSLKSWFVKSSGGDLFEALGFRYFGPIDGNDIDSVRNSLERISQLHGPRILHCITIKGKGYGPAEADPVTWHAPGRFDPATGKRIVQKYTADRYQDVFGEVLCSLAETDGRVVGVTPAMASGCGMNRLAEKMPSRFFDVGIEEEHAVTFSAGLAAGGLRPFCNIYSAFSQRAYDQIVHDVALQNLPVILCFDRAGLVGEDGATHNGAFDMAAYRSIPGTIICSPRNELELKWLMYTALKQDRGPFIIRYPRGIGEGVDWKDADFRILPVGKGEVLLQAEDKQLAVIAIGHVVGRALEAAESFPGKVSVYDFRYLKPLDTEMLDSLAASHRAILTVEDGCLSGGLYGAVCEHLQETGTGTRVFCSGIPDKFIEKDKQSGQRSDCGIDSGSLKLKIGNILELL